VAARIRLIGDVGNRRSVIVNYICPVCDRAIGHDDDVLVACSPGWGVSCHERCVNVR